MTIALLSDVHANLAALEAVLAALPSVEELWVLGDTVGYGPHPSETLALLRERGARIVGGNHDRAAATGEGIELFNKAAAEAARSHRAWLSSEERDILADLPQIVVEGEFALCHGSFRDPLWEYVLTAGSAAASLGAAPAASGCCGHTHVPALFRGSGTLEALRPVAGEAYALGPRALINPGSVGQPRDGDPRAAYALLDPLGREVTFQRVPYDTEAVRRDILARGLPAILGDRLPHGL